jgi:cytoskeletal protein CcmA (bactofilin family)
LDNIVLEGQVILEVKDSIYISRNAIIENAIIKSKIVYIESGFSGTVQIFASQKIVLEESVQLKYPSVLGLIEEEFPTEFGAKITLGKNSQVIGSVFLWSKHPNFRMLPALSISSEAEIDGLVYCAGKTQLRGTINGSLYTNKLFLKTASSAYENHLLDGQLLNQLPDSFVSANLLSENSQLKKIAWLE